MEGFYHIHGMDEIHNIPYRNLDAATAVKDAAVCPDGKEKIYMRS